MQSGGLLHIKTDNQPFFEYSAGVLSELGFEVLFQTTDLYQSQWQGEAKSFTTFYEKKFLEVGMPINYLKAKMVGNDRVKESENNSFFKRVYDVVRQIPHGRVTSYGAIAAFLGSKGSARMVGWAMNASHNSPMPVPAHRVLNRNGVLTGKHHFGSSELMQQLLENEWIEVNSDQVVDLQKYFWDPAKELKR